LWATTRTIDGVTYEGNLNRNKWKQNEQHHGSSSRICMKVVGFLTTPPLVLSVRRSWPGVPDILESLLHLNDIPIEEAASGFLLYSRRPRFPAIK
jgi:hypothetical protein